MKMASNDANPSDGSTANLVPEVNNEVMALEPVVGAAIAAPVAGQQNVIDPWIRNNFVQAPGGEFTVSPRNAPGEILWSAPLGPDLNPYLSHLARMYNGYAGGFEVQVILAGNAFTAGKIIFAAVPPNFPTEGLSPSQVTMFPHIIVDVRQLEPVLIPLPDVRNNFYHYNQSNDPTIKLIAMLYTPLRANNAGDDVFTVSCRVLTRPSPDFDFIFLVPPTVESRTKPFSVPILTVEEMTNSRFPIPLEKLFTGPSSAFVVQPQNGRCTTDGVLLGTTQLSPVNICTFRGDVTHITGSRNYTMNLATQNWNSYDPTEEIPAPLGTPDFVGKIQGVLTQTTRADGSTRGHKATVYTGSADFAPKLGRVQFATDTDNDFDANQNTKFTPVGVIQDGDTAHRNEPQQWVLPSYSGRNSHNVHLAPAVAPTFPGEQLLFFRSTMPGCSGYPNMDLDCLLPQEWVQYFYQEAAPAQSDVALLRFVNPDTGRVLFECKLHKSGYVTVAHTGQHDLVIPPNGYFRFDSWVNQFYTLAPMGNGTGRRRAL
ncbi:major capsid protein [Norovirus Hu/GII/Seoul1055/KOR/2010]|uniref:Major capsid protein n=1 Tax=Norovirus Hu/GII/Seoul1055/KOR/2010 TaxID=1336082 RepID=S4UUY4_NORV|nr:major capsid protein [Norovirus Hu/GII/Seoul1055/KOR/2010]